MVLVDKLRAVNLWTADVNCTALEKNEQPNVPLACSAGSPVSTAKGTSPRLFSRKTSFVRHAGSAPNAPAPWNRFPFAEISVKAHRELRSGRACGERTLSRRGRHHVLHTHVLWCSQLCFRDWSTEDFVFPHRRYYRRRDTANSSGCSPSHFREPGCAFGLWSSS